MRIGIASPCHATTGIQANGKWRRRRSTTSSTDGSNLDPLNGVMAGAGHVDDRADAERVKGGAGPVLRRPDQNPRGDSGDRRGKVPRDNKVLKNAPHTAEAVTATQWNRPYSREEAAFPA